jgi:hypothetical protein
LQLPTFSSSSIQSPLEPVSLFARAQHPAPPSPLLEFTFLSSSFPLTVPTPNHEIFSLTNVQAIPLSLQLAQKALLSIQRSAKAPPPVQPTDADPAAEGGDLDDAARSGVRWGEVVTPGNETGPEESSESEAEDEDEDADATSSGKQSSLEKNNKKKLNLNPFFRWNPFVPKPTSAVSTASAHPTSVTTTDPLVIPDVLPLPLSSSSTLATPPLPLLPSTLTLPIPPPVSASSTTPSTANATRSHLETKILSSLLTLFTGGQMFFSYSQDLTNSLAAKSARGGVDMLPLWRRVDRRFWWNEWLGREFIDAGVSQVSQSFHEDFPLTLF